MTILLHGDDPMVNNVINFAVSDGRQFHLVITEGFDSKGVKTAHFLSHINLKVTIIPDSAVGLWISKINLVLLGTDVVLEDGGLVANLGTYQICVLALVHKVPVYCVCETFKFMRKFILDSKDLESFQRKIEYRANGLKDDNVECSAQAFDYTPARFIQLLLTEKGPIPPTAVTHELTSLLGVS